MCIGFPGRVVEVDETGATVDIEGVRRRASTLLWPDIAPGDWVYVAAGSIVDRLDPETATEIRSTLLGVLGAPDAERSLQGGTDEPAG